VTFYGGERGRESREETASHKAAGRDNEKKGENTPIFWWKGAYDSYLNYSNKRRGEAGGIP